jgi:MerR family transcriptional regulator/heat shock protein HspR
MARKYLRITEVTKICNVDKIFVTRLEQEKVISPIVRRGEKVYSIDQVDRVRIARLLIEEMGVNLEGAEVALNMREQMIAMQRQFNEILHLLGRSEESRRLDQDSDVGDGGFVMPPIPCRSCSAGAGAALSQEKKYRACSRGTARRWLYTAQLSH